MAPNADVAVPPQNFPCLTPTTKGLAMTSTIATPVDTPIATATAMPLDLRAIAPRARHAHVFSRFDALLPGQVLQLLNDHDPQPLRTEFARRCSGQFEWAVLQSGPALWRVQLTRTGAKPAPSASSSCCSGGACCG